MANPVRLETPSAGNTNATCRQPRPQKPKTAFSQGFLDHKPNIINIIGRYLGVVLVKEKSGAIAFWCGLGRKPCRVTRRHDSPKSSTDSRSFLIQTWKPSNPNLEPDQRNAAGQEPSLHSRLNLGLRSTRSTQLRPAIYPQASSNEKASAGKMRRKF